MWCWLCLVCHMHVACTCIHSVPYATTILRCFCTYELAAKLGQYILPQLESEGIKLFFVTCGAEQAITRWQESTGFPMEHVGVLLTHP
jgi:hypothetical protein